MHKTLLLSVLVCGLLFTTTACGHYSIGDPSSPVSTGTADDPFATTDESTGFLGAITHGGADPKRDAAQNVLPYEYDGGEFALAYQFTAEGSLSGIGFLLFLDGKPQAYRIDEPDSKYEYCHSFAFDGSADYRPTFLFTPQSGAAGDTLNLTVISVTNPGFQPDMKNSTSFGWYQKALERTMELHFNVDAPQDGIDPQKSEEIFSAVQVTQEKVTASFLEQELGKYGWSDVSMDTLDEHVYFTTSYNGGIVYDNLRLTDGDTATVRYTLCGTPGAVYQVSFFLDHQPVSFDGHNTCEAVLSKGNVWSIEAALDVEKLDGFHTFYVAAVPTHSSADVSAQKSESVLLYKEK